MPTNVAAYGSGNYLLELDGTPVGFLRSLEGGEPYIDVVSEAPNAGLIAKHPGQLQCAPITISVGFGVDPVFLQWVAATLNRQSVRKSGVVIMANYAAQEVSRLSFEDALITDIRFPKFDAASKENGYLTVTFQPRAARFTVSAPGAKIDTIATKQKPWLAANFRLRIPGLEAACARVSAIESIAVTATVTSPGGLRTVPSVGALTVSNLFVTASEAVAPDFAAWFDDFAMLGNATERTATIDLLGADLSTLLFTISLSNVGIVRVKRERFVTGVDHVPQVSVEAYFETIGLSSPAGSLSAAGAVIAPPTPVLRPLSTSPVRPI